MSEPTVAELAVAAVVRAAVKQLYREMWEVSTSPSFSPRELLRDILLDEYPGMTDMQPGLQRVAETFDATLKHRVKELCKAVEAIDLTPEMTSEEIMRLLPDWAVRPVRERLAHIFSNMEKKRIGGYQA